MTYTYTNDKMTSRANGNVAWSGTIVDAEGLVVCEVWNKGDGGCNLYAWPDPDRKAGLMQVATTEYPEDVEAIDTYVAKLWEQSLGDVF